MNDGQQYNGNNIQYSFQYVSIMIMYNVSIIIFIYYSILEEEYGPNLLFVYIIFVIF